MSSGSHLRANSHGSQGDVTPPLISYDGGTRCNITVEETEEGGLVPDVDRAVGKES